MGGLQTPVTPFPVSALSPGSLELEVLNQAAGPRGEILLICVEFYYYFQLFGSGWLLLSFPPSSFFPPCHANTGFPHTALSVCLPLCFLPFPVLPHPCLSRQLTFFTSATFPPVLSPRLCLSHISVSHRTGFIMGKYRFQFIPLVILTGQYLSFM